MRTFTATLGKGMHECTGKLNLTDPITLFQQVWRRLMDASSTGSNKQQLVARKPRIRSTMETVDSLQVCLGTELFKKGAIWKPRYFIVYLFVSIFFFLYLIQY